MTSDTPEATAEGHSVDALAAFLREDVPLYIASWEGEFACGPEDHQRVAADQGKAEAAAAALRAQADRIAALEAELTEARRAGGRASVKDALPTSLHRRTT